MVTSIAQTRTNLATNPSFEGTSGTVTVQTNWSNNPSFEVDASSLVGVGGTFAQQTSSPPAWITGSAWGRFTTTTGGTTPGVVAASTSDQRINVSAGAWAGVSVNIANSSFTSKIGIRFFNSSNVKLLETQTSAVNNTGGRVSVYDQAPAGTAYVQPAFYLYNGGTTIGSGVTLDIDAIMLVTGDTQAVVTNALGSYFDGSTTASGDYSYAWSGTAGKSVSTQTGVGVAGGNVNNNAAGYRSTAWSNSRSGSLRITPLTGANADTSVDVGGGPGAMRLGLAAGNTYTVSATGRLGTTQTGTLSTNARTIQFVYRNSSGTYISTGSPALPNTPGSTRVAVTVTIPTGSTEAYVRLYNGAAAAGGDVWWDDLLVEQSATQGNYFDGSTASSQTTSGYAPPGTWTNAWTSTPDASTSVATLTVPLQNFQAALPNGTVLGAGTNVNIQAIRGLRDLNGVRTADQGRTQVDGTYPGLNLLGSRIIEIEWRILRPTGTTEQAIQTLTSAWQNVPDPATVVLRSGDYLRQLASVGTMLPVQALRIQLPGFSYPFLVFGRPTKLQLPVDTSYQYGDLVITTAFECPDGMLYLDSPSNATCGLPNPTAGLTFPATPNFVFGASSGGSITLTNTGSYNAWPYYVLTGPCQNPSIINASAGTQIKLAMSLSASDVVVVDVQNSSVTLNGTANRNNKVDPSSVFSPLAPGTNTVQFTSTDSASVAGTLSGWLLPTFSTI